MLSEFEAAYARVGDFDFGINPWHRQCILGFSFGAQLNFAMRAPRAWRDGSLRMRFSDFTKPMSSAVNQYQPLFNVPSPSEEKPYEEADIGALPPMERKSARAQSRTDDDRVRLYPSGGRARSLCFLRNDGAVDQSYGRVGFGPQRSPDQFLKRNHQVTERRG